MTHPSHHPERHLDWFSRFCMGPKWYKYKKLSVGKKTPKTAPSRWDFVTPPEEDQATGTGNMHKKIARDCMHGWFVKYPRGPTDTQTDSSSQYFTTAPTSEVNNRINKRSVHPILLNRIELKKRFT